MKKNYQISLRKIWFVIMQFCFNLKSNNLIALENFNPNLPSSIDPFHWIPKGLYYDLIDTRNENSPVVDQVSGYTNQILFNAFNSGITNIPSYKTNLLQQNPTNQTTQVTNLFLQYGY